jgi:hypothetical protein
MSRNDPRRADLEKEYRRVTGYHGDSVPFKIRKNFLPKNLYPSPKSLINPTHRELSILLFLSYKTGIPLEIGAVFPRCFNSNGVKVIVENGGGSDVIRTGMLELIPATNPDDERLRLTQEGYDLLRQVGFLTRAAV